MQVRRFTFSGPQWRLGLLLGLAFGLAEGRTAWAQQGGVRMSQRASSPSMASPSSRMEQAFGRVGGSGGAAQGFQFNRSANDVASGSTGSAPRSWGMGRNRASQVGRARPGVGRGRLLGRPSGYGMQPQGIGGTYRSQFLTRVDRATFEGVSRYSNLYPYSAALGRTATRYAAFGAPELVAKRSDLKSRINLSQKDEDVSIPAPKVTLQERLKNNLSSRRQVYEIRAMEAFKAGRYHEACSQLTLACDSIVDEHDKKVYLKLVYMYASIAAQQYTEALNTLRWVLNEDTTTRGLRNPQVLNQVRDVGSFYGNRDDYVDHSRTFALFMEPQPKTPEVLAIRAMSAWGAGDLAEATFYARQIVDAGSSGTESRWSRLYEMMQQAQQGSQAEKGKQAREPVSVSAESPPLEVD